VPGRLESGWTAGLLVGLAFVLMLPAAASASRRATAGERAAIVRAAVATKGSPTQLVRVSDIAISTAGPWATATVRLYLRSSPRDLEMASEDTFYRARGRWRDTANGNTPERTPPEAVVKDLGLPDQSTGSSHTTVIVAVVGILALLMVIGGRGTRTAGTASGGSGSSTTRPQPVQAPAEHRTTCSSCQGKGKHTCHHGPCGARGGWWEPHPHSPGNQQWVICPVCSGRGQWTCDACHGRGWT
jgi:hypothetical protein